MSWRRRAALVAVAVMVGLGSPAGAATFQIVNGDDPGEGLNDPTPVEPVAGNTGTTLGQQRLNAMQAALDVWGARLVSNVPIVVRVNFNPEGCGGTLAFAGPVSGFFDFANAPRPGTVYVDALADSLAGQDLSPDNPDIETTINSSLDGAGCQAELMVAGWYYGIDDTSPQGFEDLISTAVHEIGHGLGFLSMVDPETGARFMDMDDAFMVHLEDHSTGKTFPQMDDAERVAASTNESNLHWIGPTVVANGGTLVAGRDPAGHVQMFSPAVFQPGSSVSHWDTALSPDELMEPFSTFPPVRTPDLVTMPLMQDIGWPVLGVTTTTTITSSTTTTLCASACDEVCCAGDTPSCSLVNGTCQPAFGCPPGDVFPLDAVCDACLDSDVPRKIVTLFDRAAQKFERGRLRKAGALLTQAFKKLDRAYVRTERLSDPCYHAMATAVLAAADRVASDAEALTD